MKKVFLLGLMAIGMLSAQEFTRGLGVYPGDPKEDFAPVLVPDASTYRNLALHRPAYHSSSSDYNQTAQLATDGIKETTLPRSTSSLQGTTANQNQRVRTDAQSDFNSSWVSGGQGEQWVYVDLGAACAFDRVALSWLRRAVEGSIQTSDDAATWKTLQPLPAGSGLTDDIKLAQPAKGRYVRVLMTQAASPEGYVLSEMEVFGRGGEQTVKIVK